MNKLTIRQKALVDACKKVEITCDVGCDHGYISLGLLKANKTNFLYATDISEKCAIKTKVLLENNNFGNKAQVLVCDGLTKLADKKINQVVIAGMGGAEIIHILDCFKNKKLVSHFVFQPMKELENFRDYLQKNNFKILSDKIVKDKNKFYHIITAKNGMQKLSKIQTQFGAIKEDRNEEFFQWLEEKTQKLTKIYKNLPKNNEKISKIEKCLKNAEKILKEK